MHNPANTLKAAGLHAFNGEACAVCDLQVNRVIGKVEINKQNTDMFETMGESSTRGGEKRGWGIDAGGFCMPRYPDLKLDQRLHKTAMPFISRNRNVRCRATRGSKG